MDSWRHGFHVKEFKTVKLSLSKCVCGGKNTPIDQNISNGYEKSALKTNILWDMADFRTC